jgi:ABC-type dipeptide/oligopeptide/nickel transport system ATPase component
MSRRAPVLAAPAHADAPGGEPPLLSVHDLAVSAMGHAGSVVRILDTVELAVRRGEAVGIIGESGAGKTMLCRALVGTLPRHGCRVIGGRIWFHGTDLTRADERAWRALRGRRIAYVPQSSLAGMNPIITVRSHLLEALRESGPSDAKEREAEGLLDRVRIPRARDVLDRRAHELSGGMRQRVLIACAIARHPEILVADEPTTALDAAVGQEVLRLLDTLRRDLGMAIILVSHDLSVIDAVCEQVMVMYAGMTVETAPIERWRAVGPLHPYPRFLAASGDYLDRPGEDIDVGRGEALGAGRWPDGCRYAPRCRYAAAVCRDPGKPRLEVEEADWSTACRRVGELPWKI